MLGGGAVLVLVTLPVVGIGGYADYVGVIRNLADVTGVPNNMDLGSTLVRLGFPQAMASYAAVAGYAIALGAVLFSLRRDAEVSFMVTLGATLLLSPLLWDHYLVNALLPAAFLLQRGRGAGLLVAALVVPWVPLVGVPLVAVAAMIGPFLAAPPEPLGYAARSEGSPDPGSGSTPGALAEPAGSKRTAMPA
jgi:hypothetical protein